MPIEKTELIEDKVRVHYHLQKPYGIPDVNDFKEVFYKDVLNLSKPPKHIGWGNNSKEEIYIPTINKTIIFVFDKYLENPTGPLEEDIYGPFLRNQSN